GGSCGGGASGPVSVAVGELRVLVRGGPGGRDLQDCPLKGGSAAITRWAACWEAIEPYGPMLPGPRDWLVNPVQRPSGGRSSVRWPSASRIPSSPLRAPSVGGMRRLQQE